MIRRWLRRAATALVIGLILNVLIAWVTAMALPIRPNPMTQSSTLPTQNRGYIGSVPAKFGEPSRAFRFSSVCATYWQVQWDGPDETEFFDDEAVAHVYRHGFPLLALESRTSYVGPQSHIEDKGSTQFGVIPMPKWHSWLWVNRTPNTQYAGALPFLPLWPGLLLNTLLYATLPLGAWLGFLRWRRRRRIRHGLCPECAYELAGFAACPECGSQGTDAEE